MDIYSTIHTMPQPKEKNLRKCNWSFLTYNICVVWTTAGSLSNIFLVKGSDWNLEKVPKECEVMKGVGGKYSLENVQWNRGRSYFLKKNKLYLGNVKHLASRDFTKPLLFPGLQEAQLSCRSVSRPSVTKNIPSRFPSVSWVTSFRLSTGGSCTYSFSSVTCNQPQSPWLFLLLIYLQACILYS